MAGALRAFARYLPQPQFEALADGVLAEARLRARIEELQQYRSLGLRTFEQVDMLEAGGDRSKIKKGTNLWFDGAEVTSSSVSLPLVWVLQAFLILLDHVG